MEDNASSAEDDEAEKRTSCETLAKVALLHVVKAYMLRAKTMPEKSSSEKVSPAGRRNAEEEEKEEEKKGKKEKDTLINTEIKKALRQERAMNKLKQTVALLQNEIKFLKEKISLQEKTILALENV